jgi:succinyl-CoA synthetase beta subunit
MATMNFTKQSGEPANFPDVGGTAGQSKRVEVAFKIIFMIKALRRF